MLSKLRSELQTHANPKQAEILQKFFKTGKGEYGEGRESLGIKVPVLRKVAKKYYNLSLEDIQILLNSDISDYQFVALVVLINKYKKSNRIDKGKIFKFYLDNAKRINNWDLVDLSAPNIVGNYLIENYELVGVLEKLTKSDNLWERRIAIISTFAFIRNDEKMHHVLKISELLLDDKHDLIHKAVGWMLREFGKKNLEGLECFLRKNYNKIPRTTLRYAIEKFEEDKRKSYLRGEV